MINTLGINKQIKLLGGTIEFSLYKANFPLNESVFDEVYLEALRLEKIFNFFDLESELSNLNKKRIIIPSKELKEVIEMCLPYCELTNGEYDISKGKQFMQRKNKEEITKIKCSYKDIKIKEGKISLMHPDVMIDLGSVAKGYIGDKMKDFLLKKGITSAFIDLRGDLIFFGEFTEKILIQHPRDTQKSIFSFEKSNAAVATSGDYKQYYENYENSHILNSKDLISVTVVAKTLAEADILATCIFVSGAKKLEKFNDKEYFVMTNNLKIFTSENFV
jgi:thiamine biosynthesis lipoprotein